MVLVTPPAAPSRSTGEIEKLLVELGHPQLADLDEDSELFAERHDDLFEEIAAFARRGWAHNFDAEGEPTYDEYAIILRELLRPLGVRDVELEETGTLHIDARTFRVELPEDHNDWFDVGWIFEVANLAVSETGWQLVSIDDMDLHDVIMGVVPCDVWAAISEKQLAGAWRAMTPVETLYN